MKTISYIFLLIFLIFLMQVTAQEQLTLKQAREMALRKSENLKLAGKQLEKAELQKSAVRTLRLPNFSATATGIYQDNDFEMELILPTQKPNLLTGEMEPNIMANPATG
ncbi:MAG: TolC family protein, partial [Bacteroidales bacterium]|nr:TolC family protein [Bacteroidales bacterium]